MVRAHTERGDVLAAGAAESGDSEPGHSVAMDQDPEAVYFLYMTAWVEWDARARDNIAQHCGNLQGDAPHSQAEARAGRRRGLGWITAGSRLGHGRIKAVNVPSRMPWRVVYLR